MTDDAALVRQGFRFLRSEANARRAAASEDPAERLAARFEETLAKDVAVVDLSRASSGRLGLRWRAPAEVAGGKGERECAAVGCSERAGLVSMELPFAWREDEEARVALVATRLCSICAARTIEARAVALGMRPAADDGGRRRRRRQSRRSAVREARDEDRSAAADG